MPNLCVNGSERRVNAPATINLTSGIVCELFGVQHPVCNLVDQILPDLFPGIPFPGAIGKAIKKLLKIQGVVDDILDSLPDADIPTDLFCSVEPQFPTEEITYADVFLAFTGIYPTALLDKIAVYVAYDRWFQVCQCRPEPALPPLEPGNPGTDIPESPFPVPEPPPGCCQESQRAFAQNVVNQQWADFEAKLDNGTFLGVTGYVFDRRIARSGGESEIGNCENSEQGYRPQLCFCKVEIVKNWEYIWFGVDANGQSVIDPATSNIFSVNLEIIEDIRYPPGCLPKQPIPDPEAEPDPVLDPDFLEDACEIFPDAAVCQNRGGCGVESVSVPVITGCGEAPQIRSVQLFVSGGQGGIPGCTDPVATNYNPDATVDDGSCVYLPPIDWDAEVAAANAAGLAIAPNILCDSAQAEAQNYAQARNLTQYPEWANDKEFLVLPAFTAGVSNGGCIIPEGS